MLARSQHSILQHTIGFVLLSTKFPFYELHSIKCSYLFLKNIHLKNEHDIPKND